MISHRGFRGGCAFEKDIDSSRGYLFFFSSLNDRFMNFPEHVKPLFDLLGVAALDMSKSQESKERLAALI